MTDSPTGVRRALLHHRALLAGCLLVWAFPAAAGAEQRVMIDALDGKLRIEVDGQLFTEYLYSGHAKPVFFPIIGPHGIGMTRNYPLVQGVEGEATDHPHHKSLWFTHGDVNGVDFWSEGSGSGTIAHQQVLHQSSGAEAATLATENKWLGPDGKLICTDVREYWFRVLPQGRAIDFRITIHASQDDLTFGDTKEGSLGLRTHPNLRLSGDPPKVTTAGGKAVNSEGVAGRGVWGKRAKWVDYWGDVEGRTVGIAIFDHPANPRHPTWWHARDYGLFAANPFGIHDFENKPAGTGDLKIKKGESLTLLYRILFHEGDAHSADVAGAYEQFSGSQPARVMPENELPEDDRLGALKDYNGYFPMDPPVSVDQWQARAEQVRRRILVAAGLWPMPPRGPVRATVHGPVDRDDYAVEKVILESIPGHFVTGNLYRPKDVPANGGRRPAVLCPHGHWSGGRFHDCGRKEVRSQIVEGAERFETGGRYPLQARCVQLARMGCIVFHYDMLGYADSRQIPMEVAHRFHDHRPGMEGPDNWGFFSTQAELRLVNILGLQTLNSIRAMDWLADRPDVDPARIAVTGASGGGTQTMLLSAIEPRVAVSFPAVMVSTSMQGGCTCENACCLRVGTGNIEFAGLFAPRPLGMTAADDWTHEITNKGLPELEKLYALFGAKQNVTAKALLQFGHNYNYVSRAVMYGWMNRHLGLDLPEPIVEKDFEPLSIEEMSVWNEDHRRPPGGKPYERELVRQLAARADQQLAALTPGDVESLRRFREIVGGAWSVILNGQVPDPEHVGRTEVRRIERGDHTEIHELIQNENSGASIPAIRWEPQRPGGCFVVAVHGLGKQALVDDRGGPAAPLRTMIEQGITIVAPDLFLQGEFTLDNHPPLAARKVENPRPYAGFTLGYNDSLFARRVHDILTIVALLRSSRSQVERLQVMGIAGAGSHVAAARAMAGDAVDAAAIDTGGFRFAKVASWRDPDFLPGAVRYGDLPALVALGAPRPIWLAGEGDSVPPLARAAYRTAGSEKAVFVSNATPANSLAAATDWLLQKRR